jgi:glutathione synthase/RimK-type ligase-like ATP-grasp enzyme
VPQPILGIMTLYINSKHQIEERQYLKQCIQLGHKLGLEVFVFTPQDVKYRTRQVYGHFYNLINRKWHRKWTSLPKIIFDRCRYQPNHRFQQLRRFRRAFPNLTYLNRPLANKWVIHQLFNKHQDLKSHLPTTLSYSGKQDLIQLMKKYKTVFLKPVNGTGGRGILKVESSSGSLYRVEGRNPSRKIIKPQTLSLNHINRIVKRWSTNRTYLVQQGIELTLKNGRVHDYRLLIQKNDQGEWEYTGCAGRLGAKRSVTSNLHGGGKAMSADSLLEEWFPSDEERERMKRSMKQLSQRIVSVLEANFGQLCELALDLAIDRNGHIWLLEINPKPGRQVFSQIGEPGTYHKAVIRPLEYALWKHKQLSL